jgi:hypothetical protein
MVLTAAAVSNSTRDKNSYTSIQQYSSQSNSEQDECYYCLRGSQGSYAGTVDSKELPSAKMGCPPIAFSL